MIAPCPRCKANGQSVSKRTISALVSGKNEGCSEEIPFFFCSTQDCSVVYFSVDAGYEILKSDLRVPIFQKESSGDRMVCYCFEHREVDILRASSEIFDAIRARCKRGEDRCEVKNPQGRCCLANVRAVAKKASSLADSGTCCSPKDGGQ